MGENPSVDTLLYCTLSHRHVIYAPSRNNKYNALGFPTITDALEDRNETNIRRQIAIVTYFIRSAISVLQQPIKFQTIL